MKIGIIGAMEVEISTLLAHLQKKKQTKVSDFTFYEGEIGSHQVILVQSGIGKVSASVCATLLIQLFSPELIINTGVAGALGQSRIKDLVLATEVQHHDVDVTAFGYEIGQQAQMPAQFFPEKELLLKAEAHYKKFSSQIKTGLIVSGDVFVNTPEKKAQIQQNFPSAQALEMEAAAIAQTCYLLKTPFLIVRAISDNADEKNTLSYDQFVEEMGKFSAEINIELLEEVF